MDMRVISFLIGYFPGCILTAVFVARAYTGRSAFEIGSKNPGMANIMRTCGFKAGILVLLGDLCKVFVSIAIAAFFLYPQDRVLATAYAGLGSILGHNYPFWHRFKGGKGVAATCAVILCISPLWGILSMIVGMLAVFITQYLPVGGVVIPAVFCVAAGLLYGPEIMVVTQIYVWVMLQRHWRNLRNVTMGKEEKTDVIGAIKKKFGKEKTKSDTE